MSLIIPELRTQQTAMCRLLLKRIRGFYSDEKVRKEFEERYSAKYGEKYEWKKVST